MTIPLEEWLDCYYCEPPTLHPDFRQLALHVQSTHGFKSDQKMADLFKGLPETEKEATMNIGGFIQGNTGADRLPLLDAKLFKTLEKNGVVIGRMLACRQIKSPKFQGLAMDFKNGTAKFSFLARFDRWDVTAIVKQMGSEETDDWIGQNLRFITKKSDKGMTFVNVELPKLKTKR